MAGSRSHVTAEDGTFTFDLIDNMGDAYEACEELFTLANRYEAEVERLRAALEEIVGLYDGSTGTVYGVSTVNMAHRVARQALADNTREA